ncbi:MAG: PAS domain S-box protein [Myxococcota bacterium]
MLQMRTWSTGVLLGLWCLPGLTLTVAGEATVLLVEGRLAQDQRNEALMPGVLALHVAVDGLERLSGQVGERAADRLEAQVGQVQAQVARLASQPGMEVARPQLELQGSRLHAWVAAERATRATRQGTHPLPQPLLEGFDSLRAMVEAMDREAAARRDALQQRRQRARVVALLGVFALIGAAWLVIQRRVIKPVNLLSRVVEGYLHQGQPPAPVELPAANATVALLAHGWNTLVGEYLVTEATQQADALALSSTQRKIQILEHTRLAILAFDVHGTIVSCNPGACMLLHRRKEELLGRPLRHLFPEPVHAALEEHLRDLEILKTLASTPTEMLRADGTTVPVEVSGACLPGTSGEDDAYFILAEDITEKLRLRSSLKDKMDQLEEEVAARTDELRRERDKVAAFLEQAPDMMCELDANGRITYANRAMVRELGVPLEDLLGQPATIHLSPSDRSRVLEELSLWLSSSQIVQRLDLVTPEGVIPVEAAVTLVRGDEGPLTGARIVARSLAERTEAERRQQLLLSALENTQDGIVIADLSGRVMHANAAALRLTGRSPAEVFGAPQWELAGPTSEDQAVERKLLANVVQERACSALSTRWLGPDIAVPVSVHCALIRDAEEHPIAVVSVQRDLTEERAQQARERAYQDSLLRSEKLSALGGLIAGVAHELNNPLGAVIGYAQLIAMSATPEIQEDCGKLTGAAERCRRIVHNLLTFARKHKPEQRPADLNQIVRDAIALVEYEFSVHNIVIELALDPELPLLSLDGHQVQQVLINLLRNSQQAILEARKRGRILISTSLSQGEVVLRFEDDGPGIPEELRSKVFDPFFTTKEVGQGTGLGLSIAFGIIKEHAGTIRVDQGTLPGACLVVTLPVMQSAAPPPELPAPPVEERASSGRRILVVDDEEPIRAVVRRVLTRRSHHVDTVANTDEALTLMAHAAYDCILLDQHMPGGTGTDFLERLAATDASVWSRAVLITGDTVDPRTYTFAEQHGVRFCPKPFDLAELQQVVESVLRGGAGRLAA